MNDEENFLVYSRRLRRARRMAFWRWPLFALIILVAVAALVAGVATLARGTKSGGIPTAKYAWVQILPDDTDGRSGGRLARAIVTAGDRCPVVVIGGSREMTMELRRPPVAAPFPILLCQATLDATTDAWIGNVHLPIRPARVSDITVIGDTGCRITHFMWQACGDGEQWPFASVAANSASAMGGGKQQGVILHVGDFHYREKPCADADARCTGSPFGDNWETWETEFFKPARPLLSAAPWIILRGNHENCARAGTGWLFLFGLSPQKGVCTDDGDMYTLTIGGSIERPRVLVVLDTANEADEYDPKKLRPKKYAEWADKLKTMTGDVWLALHQPLWHCGYEEDRKDKSGTSSPSSASCGELNEEGPLSEIRTRLSPPTTHPVKLVISGDIHMFQLFRPKLEGYPIQIVAGIGGTELDTLNKKNGSRGGDFFKIENTTIFGAPGTVWGIARHGFIKLHQDATSWMLEVRDSRGETLTACRIQEASTPVQSDCDRLNENSGAASSTLDR